MMSKISVVLTHYNRTKQLINTLKTMNASAVADRAEIVIVDDAFSPTLSKPKADASISRVTEDLVRPYTDNVHSLKIISIDPADKWWKNQSCVTFNMGFAQCTGDVVVLSQAECLHRGDVLEHALHNTTKGNYLTYSCYVLSKEVSQSILKDQSVGDLTKQLKSIPLEKQHWWNHPKFKPKKRNFTASIHSEDLKAIGGFDEKLAGGHCYEDTDWQHKTSWHLKSIIVPPMPMVYHQWHPINQCDPNLKKANEKVYRQLVKARKKTPKNIQ